MWPDPSFNGIGPEYIAAICLRLMGPANARPPVPAVSHLAQFEYVQLSRKRQDEK
jgi:hypothetical protein